MKQQRPNPYITEAERLAAAENLRDQIARGEVDPDLAAYFLLHIKDLNSPLINPTGCASMATIDKRIAALEAKIKHEKAKARNIKAALRAIESKRRRSEDARRKILVGAAILAKVERGEWPQEKLLALMDAALTRADDRALFDLPAERSQDKATLVGGSTQLVTVQPQQESSSADETTPVSVEMILIRFAPMKPGEGPFLTPDERRRLAAEIRCELDAGTLPADSWMARMLPAIENVSGVPFIWRSDIKAVAPRLMDEMK
jgi:hypothetical protein